jgi:hypothetical protein
MQCTACKREIEIRARGLCAPCYQRWHKTGTTEYQRWGKHAVCHVKDCGKPSAGHGMCSTHLSRWRRHGHLDQTRPDSWGAKHKHPMNNSWEWIMRHRSQHPIAPEWEDFLQFISDVGDRPSKAHKLFAANDSRPIGPGNFVWKRALTERVNGEDENTFKARRQRARRAVHQEESRGYGLKKLYGIDAKQYAEMKERQCGRCAICGGEEIFLIRGKRVSLAVDHCHVTGKVRDLLCRACNNILGDAKDDPERLRRAIAYLERHKEQAVG